jgi:hypothetical protein
LAQALLTASDIFARVRSRRRPNLPIGVVTALIGAPFFIWLLRRNKRSFGWEHENVRRARHISIRVGCENHSR